MLTLSTSAASEPVPTVAVAVLAALLGLFVGSFLNVVIWRVPRGESVVHPRSHCPSCDRQLTWYENVPVASWVVLRGRCRTCHHPVSVRYPLVELLTAAVFGVLGWRFGASWELPAYLYLGAVGVALGAIDLDTRKLPNSIVLPSYGVAAALLGLASLLGHDGAAALRAVGAGAALYAFYYALAWIWPRGMGFGDVKLSGVVGMYLGWLELGGPGRGRVRRLPHRRRDRHRADPGRPGRPQDHHPVRPVHARRGARRGALGHPDRRRVHARPRSLTAISTNPSARLLKPGRASADPSR